MEKSPSNIDYSEIYLNEFCPHILNHFLNPFLNKQNYHSIHQNSSLALTGQSANYSMSNISLLVNKTIANRYYGYNHLQNNIAHFFLENFGLNWIAINNQQNLSFSSINKDGCIFALKFDDLGSLMATTNQNYYIEIWDLKNRKVIKSIKEHSEIVTGLEYFHNQNNMLMSSSLDKTIKIWKNYKSIHTFIEHSDWIRSISIAESNKQFLSGCVASVIKLWDIPNQKVIATVVNKNPFPDALSTVNSLVFKKQNESIFISGLRSGEVKFFDSRIPSKNNSLAVTWEFKAHQNKLNSVKFNNSETYLLSSGRDSLLRLWDSRKLPSSQDANLNAQSCVNEYKGHKCSGFNIDSNFFMKEKYIITGSEDSSIYIYDMQSTKIVQKIPTIQRCINLVRPIPNSLSFAFTGLDDLSIFIWDVTQNIAKKIGENNKNKINTNPEVDEEEPQHDMSKYQEKEGSQQVFTKLIEDIMSECGDLILKIFHSHNLTYSNGISFDTLHEVIRKSNDQESIDILNKINERFMNKVMESICNERKSKANKDNQENNKPKEIQRKVRAIKCLKCLRSTVSDIKCISKGFQCDLLLLPHSGSGFASQMNTKPTCGSNKTDSINKTMIKLVEEIPITASNYLINKC